MNEKDELLKRIEYLEARVAQLEAANAGRIPQPWYPTLPPAWPSPPITWAGTTSTAYVKGL